MIEQLKSNSTLSMPVQIVGGTLLFFALSWALSFVLPPAIDWYDAFRPAALKLLSGRSPYEIDGFFNPFWALFPLMPLAILPEAVGRAGLFLMSILCFSYTLHRLGGRLPAILLILLSPPAIHGLLNGNIDWMPLLGLLFPPWIGLFFVSIKPQIGIAIAIYWCFAEWQDHGFKGLFKMVAPFSVVFLISLLLFGLWPLRSSIELTLWWNASLWPMSIPVGLALLVAAFRQRNIDFALGASPCLAPYILLHSWIIALFALVKRLPELTAAVVGLWILVGIRAFGG